MNNEEFENTMGQFRKWSSTPRWHKGLRVYEKIDGTNGCVIVQRVGLTDLGMVPKDAVAVLDDSQEFGYWVRAQSRSRIITPGNDNFGFAKWVHDNSWALAHVLDQGYHYGEWFGEGIQKNPLGIEGRRFYLFHAWYWARPENALKLSQSGVTGLGHVPVLHDPDTHGEATWETIPAIMDDLAWYGTKVEGAVGVVSGYAHEPDTMARPEGIIVWHKDTQQKYKILLDNDSVHKNQQ